MISAAADAGATVNWGEHLSAEGAAREQPTLRIIASRYTGIPGVIGLHGGFPAAEAFPITQLSYTLRDGTSVSIDDPAKVGAALYACVFILSFNAVDRSWVRTLSMQHNI